MKKIVLLLMAAAAAFACERGPGASWTEEESSLICGAESVMRVLKVDNREDSLFLRKECAVLNKADIESDVYSRLCELMIATVIDEGGVGIAGPQVGIGRRVVAVQRFDKEAEPFELYPNIRITAVRGELESGAEGCLSVPDMRGTVRRYRDIDISYTSPATLRDTSERVQGFTAVIFQHETDHLDGIIYTDKAD